jgi:hypothetical protein
LTATPPRQGTARTPATGIINARAVTITPDAGPLYPWFKLRLGDRAFYLLPTLMWLALSLRHGSLTLPSVANPTMEAGGLWGESKAQGLGLFGPQGRRRLAPFIEVICGALPPADDPGAIAKARHDRDQAVLARLAAAGVELPIVAKPDRGYQGWGVRVVHTTQELGAYLDGPPPGATVILQELVDFRYEAGIFYIRPPKEERGRIASMAFVMPPHVVGDGRRTVAELAAAHRVLRPNLDIYQSRNPGTWDSVPAPGSIHELTNARSARLGAVYRDALHLVTPALEKAIGDISSEIPDFHFGRYDVRFRSVEELMEGKGFRIVELNGAGAEMLHIWDGTTSLATAYKTLWRQYRRLFSIAADMRRQGHRPVGIGQMIRLQREQERLRRNYPASM